MLGNLTNCEQITNCILVAFFFFLIKLRAFSAEIWVVFVPAAHLAHNIVILGLPFGDNSTL